MAHLVGVQVANAIPILALTDQCPPLGLAQLKAGNFVVGFFSCGFFCSV